MSNLPKLLVLIAAASMTPLAGVAFAESPSPEPTPVFPPAEPVDSGALGVATPVEDPSGIALDHFYRTLNATKRGVEQTRIAVFGASHIAADSFTRVFRYALKNAYGDAGIGFVVPAKPWRNYYNRDADIEYSDGWEANWVSKTRSHDDGLYGLAGISFTSDNKRDFAKVGCAKRGDSGRSFSVAEVFYWKHPEGGDFSVYIDGRWKKRVSTKAKVAGPGFLTLEVKDAKHRIEVRPRGNGPVTMFGISLDRKVPGVIMDGMGINGARMADQLEWDPQIFAAHLARRDPDLVVLAYGTNAIGDDEDPIAAYERRLDSVVTRVRSVVPQASCLLIGPSDRPIKVEEDTEDGESLVSFLPRSRQAEVIDVQRRVAHRYGCGFWDWAHAMGGPLSMINWVHADERMGAKDYVHFTRRGYKRLADLFLTAVLAPARATLPLGPIPAQSER